MLDKKPSELSLGFFVFEADILIVDSESLPFEALLSTR
ncbi:hypothetical protein F0Z19_0283 [Vibrio cyclitrophicus]|nr:hypothetical protein F0Z19_0283 [Vibrio cyclitrophicus]